MDRLPQHQGGGRGRRSPVSGLDAAHAAEYFEPFLNATTLKAILGYHRTMCELLQLRPGPFPHFYPKLRAALQSWRAKALWKKFDARASHKCYGKGRACAGARVLVIGAGPCGLRTAIEAQLLGAKVVVIEKRDRLSRNNVLHLWPFVIEDLRALGAKKFFGRFCAGSIDHISIRQLQCILLKVALLLGVEVHAEVGFENLIEPDPEHKTGWRGAFDPENHPVSQYEFDVIIGADGKRNTLQGFKRKEFRGKLAIAITANFINKKTEAEARVEEISGVAFIFNQKFFKDLHETTRIDLENIVYYKDDTHYFVMTAKKTSLLEKGVIKQDLADTEKLLAPENVDRDALHNYAREAADFSTNYQLPELEFAVNHYGQPDVAMFDFTSMYAAEFASKILERHSHKLMMILVGDSLLEPFWPTGSGCARGFLSSLDAAWAIRSWCLGTMTPLEVLAERESIYRLLAQTTPDNLNKDWKSYTLDPATRYPNLNKSVVLPHQAVSLFDTDNPSSIEKMKKKSLEALQFEAPKKRRRGNVDTSVMLAWLSDRLKEHEDIEITDICSIFKSGKVLCAIIHHYRPDLIDYNTVKDGEPSINNQMAFDVLERELGVPPIMTGEESIVMEDYLTMTTYLTQVYDTFRGEIPHIKHPKLELPETNKRSEISMKTIRTGYHHPSPLAAAPVNRPSSRHKRHADAMTQKPASVDRKTRKRRTLEKLGASVDHENKVQCGTKERRGSTAADEDIASKIKSLENKWCAPVPVDKKPKDLYRAIGKIDNSDWNIREIEKKIMENKMGKPSSQNKDKERVPRWSKEEFLARQTKMEKRHLESQDSVEAKFADIDKNIKHLELKLKEGTARDLGQNKVASITEKLASKVPAEPKPVEKTGQKPALPVQNASEYCHFCGKRVYLMERLSAEGRFFHHGCFKCQYCHTQLRLGSYSFDRDGMYGHRFFCIHHYGMQGELPRNTKVTRKSSTKPTRDADKSAAKRPWLGLDLLDRVQTPERIEFSNLSNASSDREELLSPMDEDEWTDKNFGASCAELDDSEDDSSSSSNTESDDEEAYDDAMEEPATKEGTLKWAERWKNCYKRTYRASDPESDSSSFSDNSSYYGNFSDEFDSDTATESEEEIRQRELRKQEVRVKAPIVQTDTGTDTEIVSVESSSSESSSEIHNSATEISTDSEFAHDDPTPTREVPPIIFNDIHVTKTRGGGKERPKRIQVKSSYLQKPSNGSVKAQKQDIELNLSPLVPTTAPIKKPVAAPLLLPRTEGYALNRTQSTGGIAAKVSLELKKKYLLGESASGNIQKSGSASALDNKFKSFQSTISDCQKLLKPATEISPSMQVFCSKLDERHSPVVSPQDKKALPPPDVTITTITEHKETQKEPHEFQNEPEGRPRSPVHETSITVPKIDWNKQQQQSQSSDSLSISSCSDNEPPIAPKFHIPRVEITEDNIPPDSLNIEATIENPNERKPSEVATKSVSSEKKVLNQPKQLPKLEGVLPDVHQSFHTERKADKEESPENETNRSLKTSSGKSSPEPTVALTETELSDWARDGAVSDADLELEYGEDKQMKNECNCRIAEAENVSLICGLDKSNDNKSVPTEAMNTMMSRNLDNIEFMDTGTETSSEDGILNSQDGYVIFKNEEDIPIDSLDPNINQQLPENKENGSQSMFGGEVIDLKPADLEKLKEKQQQTEHEEDSLLVIETGTTTEENTCSDSTVKNVTEIASDKKLVDDLHRQRLEKKLADLKEQKCNESTLKDNNLEFEKHCQRLESKVEFGNARDSIDVRKSRRRSKPDVLKPDLIQEETATSQNNVLKDVTLNLSPVIQTPDILYKRENIKKERDLNQKLIQEMVLNKMKAENKSLERKKRIRSPYDITKSATTDIASKLQQNNESIYSTPDLLSSSLSHKTLQSSEAKTKLNYEKHTPNRPLSVYSGAKLFTSNVLSNSENISMPDIRQSGLNEDFRTPVAPPRANRNSDINKTAEKLRENARLRVRLLSNEDLGLSPEDKIARLKEKVKRGMEKEKEIIEALVFNTDRKGCVLYSNDTLSKKKNSSFRRSKSGDSATPSFGVYGTASENIARTKSIAEISQKANPENRDVKKYCKSDPNLLETEDNKPKKKSKDRERRKSITKLIANIFTKKSPSGGATKGFFSKLSPKTKEASKSCVNLGWRNFEVVPEQTIQRKSFSELSLQKGENTPPPIPPLPLNYTGCSLKDSDDDHDWKHKGDKSSCDTLDQVSNVSISGKSGSKSRKSARQAQLKRHRMAQEIQRKLEETEVKMRELEERGIYVEKALRGEDDSGSPKEESDLLQEWFDLMRDRMELTRYEKELIVRAQELELEDRHARLQHELRERLETNEPKTESDIKIEEQIINEMMEIVSKRDMLIASLEENRSRYSYEERDLEEQMLAKGLRLTPIKKTS